MSAQKMLEQLLKSGLSGMDNSKSRNSRGDRSSDRYENADWGKSVSGTSAGGLLGMLLGSKRSRGMGGSALPVGVFARSTGSRGSVMRESIVIADQRNHFNQHQHGKH
eukprot:gene32232-54680_t